MIILSLLFFVTAILYSSVGFGGGSTYLALLFILINSLSGIIGHLTKNAVIGEIQNYWFFLLAVLIGGQLGNFLNLKIFPSRILVLVTSCLVLFVAIRMAYKLFI